MRKITFILTALVLAVSLILPSCKKKDTKTEDLSPKASFTMTNNGCTGPCIITFANTSTNADAFAWDFGDGETSDQKNPTHQYSAEGTYVVKLTANKGSLSNSTTQNVSIAAPANFISYYARGKFYSFPVLSASRFSGSPRHLTLEGSYPSGLHDITLSHEESSLGFSPGINVTMDKNSLPKNFISLKYIDGKVYSSRNVNADGFLFFQELKFQKDAKLSGKFSGDLVSSAGDTISLSTGKYSLIFKD